MNSNQIFAWCFNFFRKWKVRKNQITLIEKLNTGGNGSLFEIKKECEKRGLPFRFNIIRHADYELRPGNLGRLVRLFTKKAFRMAVSSHIFLNDNFMPLAYMKISEETTVVQLWHGMGSFKKFGASSEKDPEILNVLKAASRNTDHILASSEHIRGNYAQAFMVPEEKVLCIGCPQADYYFQEHDTDSWKQELCEQYPGMKGKKLVLYAPTFRDDRQRDRELLDAFDFRAFGEALGEEYFLMVRLHPQIQSAKIPENVADLTWYPDVRRLLYMTDLLIADYSSIAVEYSLLNRPIILYAFDKEWYLSKDRGFYFDFEKTAPGPVVETMEDLISCIREQRWDLEKVKRFANLHNDFFDDRSVERIVDYYFGRTRKLMEEGKPFYENWKMAGRKAGSGKLPEKWATQDATEAVKTWEKEKKARQKKQAEGRPQKEREVKKAGGRRERKESTMKIIAGLGNPTDQYKDTRHNIGFMAIDRLAQENHIEINQHKWKAMTGTGIIGGQKVLLVKPLTYMNLSGESLRAVIDFYKIDLEDLLVIYDDISLEPGLLRIRTKGSAGGHNGMKSIIKHLGDDHFPRIRVGIGGEKHPGQDLADYVLGQFRKEEKTQIEEALDKAVQAATLFAAGDLPEAMNRFSVGKKKRAATQAEEGVQ